MVTTYPDLDEFFVCPFHMVQLKDFFYDNADLFGVIGTTATTARDNIQDAIQAIEDDPTWAAVFAANPDLLADIQNVRTSVVPTQLATITAAGTMWAVLDQIATDLDAVMTTQAVDPRIYLCPECLGNGIYTKDDGTIIVSPVCEGLGKTVNQKVLQVDSRTFVDA